MEVIVGLIALVIVAVFFLFGRSHVERLFDRIDWWEGEEEEEKENVKEEEKK
ncbi:hypothetical protein SAMN02910400_00256 [Lachnospiraceae bacterium C10]|jgi:hypothetical protein|nr:hypothetical protein [Lachnospiraceae bacterium]SCW30492.1 hypothetical protein SAMN02910400_00256 [Lachnospiraceae bacterium C10]SDW32996.1 hypothetical protein SAMN05216391_10570 [Lachnospiraceae bacterium KHCPX20]